MKYALVTGSSGGIGSVIANTLLENGWNVIGLDVIIPDFADYDFIQCDLSDHIDLDNVTNKVINKLDQLNLVVNCAAYQDVSDIDEIDVDNWDKTMNTNLRAPWFLIKKLKPLLSKSNNANVINIGSVHSRNTSHGMTSYAASKAALSSLTRSASIELISSGIRVNSIIPGAVDSPMLKDHLTNQQIAKLIDRQIIPDLIDPKAIADMVLYLNSDSSKNITGQDFIIDSGVLSLLATEVK